LKIPGQAWVFLYLAHLQLRLGCSLGHLPRAFWPTVWPMARARQGLERAGSVPTHQHLGGPHPHGGAKAKPAGCSQAESEVAQDEARTSHGRGRKGAIACVRVLLTNGKMTPVSYRISSCLEK
jgi:hypothetical protein